MRIVRLLCSLFSSALKKFLHQVVLPEDKEEQLAPIRYIGDPTEIYLA